MMKCPSCEELLIMAERQGIEIDYCPKCRGVWLDKGELDKIIERSASAQASQEQKQYEEKRSRRDDDDDDDDNEKFLTRGRRKDGGNNPTNRRG
jgi:Zn-finger nucleic acid-binding protein